jgi:tripartite-type tricarboxylate transporter receptor subunit TctC
LQFGRLTRLPELPDVPTGREIAKDDRAKALLEFAELPFFMALPFAAPPGLPPDRAKALQTAFMAMCGDPSFVDEAKKLGLDISPIDGEKIASLLARAAATPKDVIDRFNEIGKK